MTTPVPSFREALESVLQRARDDAAFFHKLVFDPDAILSQLPDNRQLKAAIYGINPSTLLSLGEQPGPIEPRQCSTTCGSGSCQNTCGEASCGTTCSSSCHGTCGLSCGATTHLV